MCWLGDYALRPAYAKHRRTTEFWRSMSVDQWRKAAASCFHQPGVTTSTSTDSTLKKVKSRTRLSVHETHNTRSLKRVRVQAAASDAEED